MPLRNGLLYGPYESYGIYKGGEWINEIKATYKASKMVTGRG